MSAPDEPGSTDRGLGPFLAFGLVAGAAAIGAIWEEAYYAGNSALDPGVLGTLTGIVIAVLAFFAWGLRASPNE
jgi:hypothetical protein